MAQRAGIWVLAAFLTVSMACAAGVAGEPAKGGEPEWARWRGPNADGISPETGRNVWTSAPGIGGYATPVVFKIGAKPVVAVFGEKAFYLVDFASGRPFGSHPWVTEYDVNAADPAVSGTTVFITSGDLVCLDLKK